VKFLLVFLFVAFVLGLRAGTANEPARAWPLVIGSFVLGVGFLFLRVINA
jgi:hypothetical protein